MRNEIQIHRRSIKVNRPCAVLLLGLSVLLPSLVQAESPVTDDERTAMFWQLWAKPRICIVPSDRRHCVMDTDINWTGSIIADICLLWSEDSEALRCWRNTQTGHLLQSIDSENAVRFWLSRPGDDQILVETKIRIVNIPPRRIRRRRRHIWSLL